MESCPLSSSCIKETNGQQNVIERSVATYSISQISNWAPEFFSDEVVYMGNELFHFEFKFSLIECPLQETIV